jgi:hypothetical protein
MYDMPTTRPVAANDGFRVADHRKTGPMTQDKSALPLTSTFAAFWLEGPVALPTYAATTVLARRALTSRMGGWPKKRLYSRLN